MKQETEETNQKKEKKKLTEEEIQEIIENKRKIKKEKQINLTDLKMEEFIKKLENLYNNKKIKHYEYFGSFIILHTLYKFQTTEKIFSSKYDYKKIEKKIKFPTIESNEKTDDRNENPLFYLEELNIKLLKNDKDTIENIFSQKTIKKIPNHINKIILDWKYFGQPIIILNTIPIPKKIFELQCKGIHKIK
jgi:hypothetical protein